MAVELLDVVIVGAGLSGIGQAVHLQRECPDKSYAILEGRDAIGGTWDLFRYPGIRSDSDMYTLGYGFKPWTHNKAIAQGETIREYIRETAGEYGIEQHVRFNTRVTAANWSSNEALWHITAQRTDTGETVHYAANMLLVCAGYYSYKQGHRPDFPGEEAFKGTVVHPQHWPEDLDYSGKRAVIIGSGATAITLVPSMADTAGHVTMLQRSPTYVISRPSSSWLSTAMRRVLPDSWVYNLTRWCHRSMQHVFYNRTRSHPEQIKTYLLNTVKKKLGPDFDVEKHFTPSYNPWDQRLCLIPDDDLFDALKSGDASVVTDTIETFTETGIQLTSGAHLDADIIVTATGLELVIFGELEITVDGAQVDYSQRWTYKGIAMSGVPNFITTFGYLNASWTLRADLISQWVCRLINHMDETGQRQAMPTVRPEDENMTPAPHFGDFTAGYLQRVMHLLPKQGDHAPWTNPQDYVLERKVFLKGPIDDGHMVFSHPAGAERPLLVAAE
ncbi:MAG: NAD(P)/FAD-dependent oxidoreductase [Pseudomonadota bacterium]